MVQFQPDLLEFLRTESEMTRNPAPVPTTAEDMQVSLRVLREMAFSPDAVPHHEELERLIARIYKRVRKERRRESEQQRRQSDAQTLSRTGRVRVERSALGPHDETSADDAEFSALQARSRRCYVCKQPYRDVHHFYHLLCPDCARLNFAKRNQSVDMTGRIALVTGGRIKIGFQTALKLLRCGARVSVTTRFPKDAAARYAQEADFSTWQDRLTIFPADFRDVPGFLRLIEMLRVRLPALDILINNAAQSVRNSADYLHRLQRIESAAALPANLSHLIGVMKEAVSGGAVSAAGGASSDVSLLTNTGQLDRHGELIDQRESHSWTNRLAEVEPVDLLESLLINVNAPCLLASRLKPLFLRSPFRDRFVINVTGLDGQFGRSKSDRHPHVNMTKAALNMLTRTSAADYAQSGIFMNSVDTGWITHLASNSRRMQMQLRGFVPPLDEVDGAARILDPVLRGIHGELLFGQLWRHFRPSTW